MRFNYLFAVLTLVGLLAGTASDLYSQDQKPAAPTTKEKTPDAQDNQLPREQRIANYLTGAKFVGSYTIDSKGLSDAKEETYTISKAEKLPAEDMYRLTARIQYGDTDGEFPMELKILWAGNTPVITLDQVWIPGLGTFSARVLILNGRYSGTWDHDAVGGHLIGRIVKEPTAP
jgi:hypothetical protein